MLNSSSVKEFLEKNKDATLEIYYLTDYVLFSYLENKYWVINDEMLKWLIKGFEWFEWLINLIIRKIEEKIKSWKIYWKVIIPLTNYANYFDVWFIIKIWSNTKNFLNYFFPLDLILLKEKTLKLERDEELFLIENKFNFIDFEEEILSNYLYNLYKDELKDIEKKMLESYKLAKKDISEYII